MHTVKAEITEKKGDTVVAVASTDVEDRHGEIVSVEGWDTKNFQKQPRILWAHDHSIPAIGKATKVWVDKAAAKPRLMFEMKFQEVTELGRAAKELVKQGFIDTFSVGFRANDMEENKFTSQELLEISLVNVPANPEAQILAFKSLSDGNVCDKDMQKVGVQPMYVQLKQTVDQVNAKMDSVVKGLASLNPQNSGRKQDVIESRLALNKVVARATDQILTEKPDVRSVQLAKVIKRANEKIIISQKKEL